MGYTGHALPFWDPRDMICLLSSHHGTWIGYPVLGSRQESVLPQVSPPEQVPVSGKVSNKTKGLWRGLLGGQVPVSGKVSGEAFWVTGRSRSPSRFFYFLKNTLVRFTPDPGLGL
jgi:hypothetical protein